MITTTILEFIWGLVEEPLSRVPNLNINYDDLSGSSVYQYLQAALYLFPMDTVIAICTISAALWILRVVIAFLRALWASLPIV